MLSLVNILLKFKEDIVSLSVSNEYHTVYIEVKPIFHCDAKPFALGTFASHNAKDSTFASPNAKIPTCWYLLRYVTQIFRVT